MAQTLTAPILQSPTALKLTAEDLSAISAALGLNIRTREDLLKAAKNVTSIRVEGVDITLSPGLLHRLESRCYEKHKWAEFIKTRVLDGLHTYVGW